MNKINVFIGYDIEETIAYHVCCESLIRTCSSPLAIHPLYIHSLPQIASIEFAKNYPPSTQFVFSRFLVPYLMGYSGIALFLDGDMIINSDISSLFLQNKITNDWAVKVVKHDYKTSSSQKFKNTINLDYPRKNWSSVILWNCNHPANQILTPDYINNSTGSFLHRFGWLEDNQIGSLEKGWNVLADEENQETNLSKQHIYHYTLGTPCFSKYKNCQFSSNWHRYQKQVNSFIE